MFCLWKLFNFVFSLFWFTAVFNQVSKIKEVKSQISWNSGVKSQNCFHFVSTWMNVNENISLVTWNLVSHRNSWRNETVNREFDVKVFKIEITFFFWLIKLQFWHDSEWKGSLSAPAGGAVTLGSASRMQWISSSLAFAAAGRQSDAGRSHWSCVLL